MCVKSPATPDSGHRTEARIIEVLRRSASPLAVSEVADALSMHPNGIRNHLRRLEARQLVSGAPERGAIGRPRVLWSVTPRAVAEAELPHTGWSMARSLARAIPATSARLDEVETAGIEMGRELADELGSMSDGDDPMQTALKALGFAPERQEDGERVRYRLRTCPYAEAVKENPSVVCTLHRGVVRGVLERVQPTSELTDFEPHPPEIAGCIVEISTPGRGGGTP